MYNTEKVGVIMSVVLSMKQLQELLGVSRPTIYKYMGEGLPHFKVGKLVRFEREVVLQWFKDRSKQQG